MYTFNLLCYFLLFVLRKRHPLNEHSARVIHTIEHHVLQLLLVVFLGVVITRFLGLDRLVASPVARVMAAILLGVVIEYLNLSNLYLRGLELLVLGGVSFSSLVVSLVFQSLLLLSVKVDFGLSLLIHLIDTLNFLFLNIDNEMWLD